jgi:hypothetical protein
VFRIADHVRVDACNGPCLCLVLLKMSQGPRRLIWAANYLYRLRLCQATYKSIFCLTLREYSNTPNLCSVKQKFRIGDAVAVLQHAQHPSISRVRRQQLPLFVAILYQRILSFPNPSWFPSVQAPTDSAIPSSQCFLLQIFAPMSLHPPLITKIGICLLSILINE